MQRLASVFVNNIILDSNIVIAGLIIDSTTRKMIFDCTHQLHFSEEAFSGRKTKKLKRQSKVTVCNTKEIMELIARENE